MSHKRDIKMHRARVKHAHRLAKEKYLILTRNNEITPDNFDREVQNTEVKSKILRICRRLGKRHIYMPLYPLAKDFKG